MKPEEITQWAWDEASKVAEYINDTTVLHSLVMNAAAHAILQARSQAFEESTKIVDGYNDAMAIAGENGEMLPIAPFISQAIRQHSQKGRVEHE